jgi:tetratricopeptide (TPR) repeat protein
MIDEQAAGSGTGGGTGGAAAGAGAGGGGPSSARDALAAAAGQDEAAKHAALPDAPPGASAQELVQAGHALYESGRTLDARTKYQQALKLDPGCEICTVRIERLDIEIRSAAEQQLEQASRAYDSMSFGPAIAACESVLQLAPNPGDPLHIRAADLLERARARAKGAP